MSDSNTNSIIPYSSGTLEEAIGITRFPTGTVDNWNQLIGGLILQGGISAAIAADAISTITFSVVLPKKLLGIFIAPISPDGTTAATPKYSGAVYQPTLQDFKIINDGASSQTFYWFAIGF